MTEAIRVYMEWARKNIFTILGIIIILLLVLYDSATVQYKIKTEVDKCNEYWVEEVKSVCPFAVSGGYKPTVNDTLTGNFTIFKE